MANQQQVESLTGVRHFYDAIHRPTPVSNKFFAPENITYLKEQLEKVLHQLTGDPIRIVVTDEFIQTMYDIASRNEFLAHSGENGLRQLNEMFLEWEARIQYLSLRHRKLYYQYFIDVNRMRVFPYGTPEKTMKGETIISPSGYMMSNPWHKRYSQFRHDVLCHETGQ